MYVHDIYIIQCEYVHEVHEIHECMGIVAYEIHKVSRFCPNAKSMQINHGLYQVSLFITQTMPRSYH